MAEVTAKTKNDKRKDAVMKEKDSLLTLHSSWLRFEPPNKFFCVH